MAEQQAPPPPPLAPPPPPPPSPARTPALSREPGGEPQPWIELGAHSPELRGYRLGRPLAQDAATATYAGLGPDGAELRVAVLSPRFNVYPELLAGIRGELLGWAAIRQPGLVTPLAVGTFAGHLAAIYPRPPGTPLEELLAARGAPLAPEQALRLVHELARALALPHRRGMACGDIRTARVQVDGPRAALTDLGLGRAAALGAGFGQFGMAFGHPSSLAPEVLQEGLLVPGPATDVYALGILLYQLLAGRLPFEGSPEQVLRAHLERALPPPPPESVSVAVAGVLLRLTAKRPDARIADAGKAAEALETLLPRAPVAVTIAPWDAAALAAHHAHAPPWSVERVENATPVGPQELGRDAAPKGTSLLPPGLLADALAEARGQPASQGHTAALQPLEPPGLLGGSTEDAALFAPRVAEPSPGRGRRGKGSAEDAARDRLGTLEMGEKLGEGSVGRTYAGSLGDRPVVVKVVSSRFAPHPALIERLKARVRAGQAVEHPGLVRALHAAEHKGRTLVVFEQVAGRTLAAHLAERGPFPPAEAVAIVRGLAEVLGALHEAGQAHGDLRPAKVLIDGEGRPRLLDLGLAEASCLGAGFGQAGLPFGHPGYLAPEVLQEGAEAPTARADLYSLGIVFYELLAGRAPFPGTDPRLLQRRHLTDSLPPPPRAGELPPDLAQLVLRLTAKAPERRPGSAREVLAELDRVRLEPGGSRPAPATGAQPPLRPVVEELDPREESISPEAWQELGARTPRPAPRWSPEKIAQATPVAPEISSDPEGGGPDPFGELRSALAAAASRGTAAGKAPGKPQPAPRAGQAQGSPSPSSARRTSRLTLLLAAAVTLLLAGAALLILVVLDQGSGQATPAAEARRGPPREDGQAEATPERAAPAVGPGEPARPPAETVEAELRRYAQRVEAGLRDPDAKLLALDEELSAATRSSAEGKARVQELEAEVRRAIAIRVGEDLGGVERLVAIGELEQASRQVEQIRGWAGDDPTVGRVAGELQRQVLARDQRLAALTLPERFDPVALDRTLRSRLKGWTRHTTRLLEGGGFALAYSEADGVLAADLSLIAGAAPSLERAPAPGGPVGLRLQGGPEPVLLLLPLPIRRPLEARLTVVLADAPRPGARVGLALGASSSGGALRGHGVVWGIVPARLADGRLAEVQSEPLPQLAARRQLRFDLRLVAEERLGRVRIRGALVDLDGGTSRDGPDSIVPADDLRGGLALACEGTTVWITALEVRGLIDPERVGQ